MLQKFWLNRLLPLVGLNVWKEGLLFFLKVLGGNQSSADISLLFIFVLASSSHQTSLYVFGPVLGSSPSFLPWSSS